MSWGLAEELVLSVRKKNSVATASLNVGYEILPKA